MLNNYFDELPTTTEVIINLALNDVLNRKVDEGYLSPFMFMAQKGLFAFDKTDLESVNGTRYHWVVPVHPIILYELPASIRSTLELSSYQSEAITSMQNITFIL